jgi:hypothetical protein
MMALTVGTLEEGSWAIRQKVWVFTKEEWVWKVA